MNLLSKYLRLDFFENKEFSLKKMLFVFMVSVLFIFVGKLDIAYAATVNLSITSSTPTSPMFLDQLITYDITATNTATSFNDFTAEKSYEFLMLNSIAVHKKNLIKLVEFKNI
ncbi:MAG: hypothetical protein H7263_19130 [Candidatus Sericytochromatia bacterium]|nr:hypothetical protein [Candidatus Sericytochromatia bacterium]